MRRRDKAGGKAAKTQRHKTLKRRNATKVGRTPPATDANEKISPRAQAERGAAAADGHRRCAQGHQPLARPTRAGVQGHAGKRDAYLRGQVRTMFLREGDAFRVVALHNAPSAHEGGGAIDYSVQPISTQKASFVASSKRGR